MAHADRLTDRITLRTPEGVDVDLALAGLGSRFLAGALDLLIQGTAVYAILTVLGAVAPVGGTGFVVAIAVVLMFLVIFGYDVAMEVWSSGRSVGKLAAGLRVVRDDGGPITFMASLIRNVLRIVDGFGLLTFVFCPVGITSILVSRRNQRLGDHAAGALVVRERTVPAAPWSHLWPAPAGAPHLAWDVSSITGAEMATVIRFLSRRPTLDLNARQHLAAQLATRLGPRVGGADPSWPAEMFLEGLAAAKTSRA